MFSLRKLAAYLPSTLQSIIMSVYVPPTDSGIYLLPDLPEIPSVVETLMKELDERAAIKEQVDKKRFKKIFWVAFVSLILMIATLAVALWQVDITKQSLKNIQLPSASPPDSSIRTP